MPVSHAKREKFPTMTSSTRGVGHEKVRKNFASHIDPFRCWAEVGINIVPKLCSGTP